MELDWANAPTGTVIDTVLAGHPDVAAQLTSANEQAWMAVDPVLLELVRLRVAMLLGNDAELAVRTPAAVEAGLDETTVAALSSWPVSPLFGPTERAVLAFVEQWLIDVATLSDEQAEAVRDALGPEGLASFASALLVIEQRQRLRLAWTRLFAPTSETLEVN